MKHKVLRFRTFNCGDREGFVLVVDKIPPKLILEDILFQLFGCFYHKIKSPEVYYFTESQQLLSHEDITPDSSYIYVHFQQREHTESNIDCYSKPFVLCDFEKLAKGLRASDKGILYIFSQKQFMAYRNKKYCQIVKERIDDQSIVSHQRCLVNETFVSSIKSLLPNKDSVAQMKLKLQQEKQRLTMKDNLIAQLTESLLSVKQELGYTLKLVGINLKSAFDLGDRSIV